MHFSMGRIPVTTDPNSSSILGFSGVKFYNYNSLSRRSSTVWLSWFRNDYILLDIIGIELLNITRFLQNRVMWKHSSSVVGCSSTLSIHLLFTMFMKHLCIACNIVVAFEISPAINMNATKLSKLEITLNIRHCL